MGRALREPGWGRPLLIAFGIHALFAAWPLDLPVAETRAQPAALTLVMIAPKPLPEALRTEAEVEAEAGAEEERGPRPPSPRPKARPLRAPPPAAPSRGSPDAPESPEPPPPGPSVQETGQGAAGAPPPEPASEPEALPPPDLGPYRAAVRERVRSERRYPRAAKRRGMQGKVLVALVVGREGRLAGPPRVARSSGHSILDQEALEMVARAAPFGALPTSYRQGNLEILVPVEFRLER